MDVILIKTIVEFKKKGESKRILFFEITTTSGKIESDSPDCL